MNRKDIIFAGIAVAVIGLFIYLSLIGKKPTPLTARAEHAGVSRETPRETCWSCHTPDAEVWLRHPKKGKPPDQTTPCAQCHKFPETATALFRSTKNSINENREGLLTWLNRQQK
jgi:hypothetical protein